MICCQSCAVLDLKVEKAVFLAPQWEGGDENGHVNWIPVCDDHMKTWYNNVDARQVLSSYEINEIDHLTHHDHSGVEDEVGGKLRRIRFMLTLW